MGDTAKLKKLYIEKRDEFRSNDEAMKELDEWRERNVNFKYKILNGLIPSKIIKISSESPDSNDFKKFVNGDTWFTLRQSSISTLDPRSQERDSDPLVFIRTKTPTPEGQAFGHCLVIPKERIFNIVDPQATENNCKVIKDLRDHFIYFWTQNGGPKKLRDRTRRGFDEQNKKLVDRVKPAPISSSSSPSMTRQKTKEYARREALLDKLESQIKVWNEGFEAMAKQFLDLQAPDDFVFGFHPFPLNSVGHLHLHVYPRKTELRRFSSWEHDEKTVEFDTVLEAEGEAMTGGTDR